MMKKIIGLCITLLFLGLIFYKIDMVNVIRVLKLFHVSYLPYITLLYIIALGLRGVRWKLFLGNEPKYSWLHLAEISTVGTMLNIFIPARAGDLFRAYYIGKVKGEKKLKIFGSVILERLLDGTAIFLILLFSVKVYFSTSEAIRRLYAYLDETQAVPSWMKSDRDDTYERRRLAMREFLKDIPKGNSDCDSLRDERLSKYDF